jgi:hypothetical protein
VELRFVSPVLNELDILESEVLVCTVWQDVRPCEGVASLCDWRFAGTISRLQRGGFLAGQRGEVLLVPGRPRLAFEKLLLFGAGVRSEFDKATFSSITQHMLQTVTGLCSRTAVVELPGRQADLIAPELAADMLLEAAGRSRQHETWTLVEPTEARRRITQHMIEEKRRIRRMQ